MKINWSAFFQTLPALIVATEQIYGDVAAGKQKKATVLQMVGIVADDVAPIAEAELDPHNATIAQAASATVDNIVDGYNQAGWPSAAPAQAPPG